jgi:hAT family C-terminal dimerisation region
MSSYLIRYLIPYKEYSEGRRLLRKPDSVFKWWNSQTDYPELRQMAFDFLSTPAMSSETERVFSQTKHTISDTRGRLGPAIVEAIECERR